MSENVNVAVELRGRELEAIGVVEEAVTIVTASEIEPLDLVSRLLWHIAGRA